MKNTTTINDSLGMRLYKSNLFFIAALILCWGIMLLITNPSGNFPLNDDYMYARTVSSLLTIGDFKITDIYSPVLVAQSYWGALFCLPFGFSFMALRVSVIVLGITGSVVFYLLLTRLGNNKALSFICTLVIICNPLFFCLSNSFMTDIPFLSFSIIAIYCFMLALEKPGILTFTVATIAAILATLVRQFGIIIPIAFFITALVQRNQKIVWRLLYILPLIVVVWLLHYTLGMLNGKGYYPYNGDTINKLVSSPMLLLQVFSRSGAALYYAGFFLLPIVLLIKNPFVDMPPWPKVAVSVVIVLFMLPLLYVWPTLPSGNYLNTASVGPLTINGGIEVIPGFPVVVLSTLRLIGLAGAILLLANAGAAMVKIMRSWVVGPMDNVSKNKMLVVLIIIGYTLLMSVFNFFFDRYLLYLFPLFLIVIFPATGETYKAKIPLAFTSGFLILVFAAYSVIGTHNYLAWNRARWHAARYLVDECKISPHKIDGGYEFNGWYIAKYYPLVKGKDWWFVDDDEYIISTDSSRAGYSIIKSYPYTSYVSFKQAEIYILHRNKL